MRSGLDKNKHAARSDWATDIDGAAAEMAYAKSVGCFWCAGLNTFKAPDVGSIQVRSTAHRNGHLIVRRNDADDDTFVLVLTDAPIFDIIGSMKGVEAKADEFWREPRNNEAGAWWVPQDRLHHA